MEGFFLTHDIGTSCDKAALVDLQGRVRCVRSQGYPIHFGPDGQAEQDPLDWWRAFCGNNAALLAEMGPCRILAVAVSGQMMACLPVDRQGEPLCRAMIWADSRSEAETGEIVERLGAERYYALTGMRASSHHTLSKMRWLMKNEPQTYEKTFRFLAAKDYINFRLTGRFATDREDAAYMHAYDIRRREWSPELLDAAGLDLEKMPEALGAASVLGTVSGERAAEAGLAPGIPVVLCTGDGDAATLGAGVVDLGDAYTSIGTSSWVSSLSGTDRLDPRRRTAKADYFGAWRDSGTMQAGGFSYGWMKDILGGMEIQEAERTGRGVYQLLDSAAARVPVGSNGVLFLPYLLGERCPWWDSRLSGAFLGLTGDTRREDMVRAVLEGVALHLGIILDMLREICPGSAPKAMRLIGGGGKSALWRQIFADVYDLPVLETNVAEEAGALGCAVMAGVGLGLYPDIRVIRQFETCKSVTQPRREAVERYAELRGVLAGAAEALAPSCHALWRLR